MAADLAASTTPFGALLRRLRVAAGLTQEALAERAGLSARGLSDLERGIRASPRADTLQLLIAALAMEPADRAALAAAAKQSALPTHGRPSRRVTSSDGASPFPGAILPVPAEPLLGRETAVEEVAALLRDPAVRVVTLTGPGGVGKTRLALQVAAESSDDFPGGAAFVPLAAIRDPALVLPTVAQALGVREGAGRSLEEGLAAVLRERRVLLVLDNLEQVLEAAPAVGRLLAACPELRILATSRVPLRLSDEQRYPVPPLAFANTTEGPENEASVAGPAVNLFVQRARRVRPDFSLTPDSAQAVTALCRRLDGLPLAIELAAARVAVLSPAALLARFERTLPLLSEGARDQPERLQTMRNAIAWSYDLLPAADQALFRQLAVFESGFALDAAEVVCLFADSSGLAVFDGVATLVEASMLLMSETGDAPRFSMLETIREYGLEQLAASGEEQEVRARHAAWMLALAEVSEHELLGAAQRDWWVRIEAERANARSALAWFEQTVDAERAQRLAAAMSVFGWIRGHLLEGQDWLRRALAIPGESSAFTRARALFGNGMLSWFRGEYAEARSWLEQSLTLSRDVNFAPGVAMSLQILAVTTWMQGDLDRALEIGEEAIALGREAVSPVWFATLLSDMGTVALLKGDDARGEAWSAEGLALCRFCGNRWYVAIKLNDMGVVAQMRGDVVGAARFYRESVQLFHELDDTWLIAYPLSGLAALAVVHERPQAAAHLLGAAAALREASGARVWTPEVERDDQTVATAQAVLGEDAYAEAIAAGRKLSVAQAVDEAVAIAEQVTGDG